MLEELTEIRKAKCKDEKKNNQFIRIDTCIR
jgi:hypothetical protein